MPRPVQNEDSQAKKRSRACEGCQRLKIKCIVSPTLGAACERCSRNNLECIPAAPRLQRDRISELEAQVEELRNTLRGQSSSTTPSRSPGALLEDSNQAVLSLLDGRIPLSKQRDLLQRFPHYAGAAWPVVRLSLELDQIRAESPILLLCVLVHTIPQETQGIEVEVHDELVKVTMLTIGDQVIGKGQRSLGLVQALLVTAFWTKPVRGSPQASCYQIVQLAVDMAIDLGIAGSSLQPSPAAYFSRQENPESLEARRTWLACFVALSMWSLDMRRPPAVSWNVYHEECLLYLETRGDESDMLLCQIVRISQLEQDVSSQLCLCQINTFADGNDYSTHSTIAIAKNMVDIWATTIPPSLASSLTLKMRYHVAMIRIYEVALHTPTNKGLFAAPFIPGRIAVSDFPKPPAPIPPLITALEALIQHCHAVIDTSAEMDPALILSLPTFGFAPTTVYALYILVTVLVAATGPENTYGQVLSKDMFCIEECSLKLQKITARLKALDPTLGCWTTRMFDATGWLEEWYRDYSAIILRYENNIASV